MTIFLYFPNLFSNKFFLLFILISLTTYKLSCVFKHQHLIYTSVFVSFYSKVPK